MDSFKNIVLVSCFLGGAEIFTLERLLQAQNSRAVLHCNSILAQKIKSDGRYSGLHVRAEASLDSLASCITIKSIVSGVRGILPIIEKGGVLFANLRAASLMLHPKVWRRSDAFIHDNSHYLNFKTRAMVSLIVGLSNKTFFPCLHSTLRIPFSGLLSQRMIVEYFDTFQPLGEICSVSTKCLRFAMVGRIEPAKNQMLALGIANRIANDGYKVHLTFVGAPSDENYFSNLMSAPRHPNLVLVHKELVRSEVPTALKQHDIILHTSIVESLPLVLFESNSIGVPFFALPVGGIPEVLPCQYWLDLNVEVSVMRIKGLLLHLD